MLSLNERVRSGGRSNPIKRYTHPEISVAVRRCCVQGGGGGNPFNYGGYKKIGNRGFNFGWGVKGV